MRSTKDRHLTPDAVKTDLDALLSAFADIHPNPFWSRTRSEVQGSIAALVAKSGVTNGMTEGDFFQAVARLVIAFDDPHCWAFVPGWKEYREGGGRFFPLTLRFTDLTAEVVSPAPKDCPLGSSVTTINGIPLTTLIQAYRPLTGQRNDPFGDEFLETFFRRYLWYFQGDRGEFTVGLRAGSAARTVTVRSVDQAGLEAMQKQAQSLEPLRFRLLEPGTGLLEFDHCVAPEKVRALAEPIFARLRNEKITRLVVDARDNTGGGDDAWITLLEFLTEKPFMGYAGTSFRASQRLKDLLGKEAFTQGYGPQAWDAPAGTRIEVRYGAGDLVIPPKNPLRFTGTWCVVAGRRTFSAGMSFICAIKAYHLAKVVGEETGGRVKGFGQWVEVKLPETGLSVAISTKQFDGAVQVPFRRGVPPDISARPLPGVVANSPDDPLLKAALKQLR